MADSVGACAAICGRSVFFFLRTFGSRVAATVFLQGAFFDSLVKDRSTETGTERQRQRQRQRQTHRHRQRSTHAEHVDLDRATVCDCQ